MKSTDLKVGTDYAYQYRNWGAVERVTVLAVGVTGHDANARGWKAQDIKVKGLVKIRYCAGNRKGVEELVRPQTLKMTWSQHHGEAIAAGRRMAERKREEQAQREQRAYLAFTMHQRLLTAGAPMELVAVYDDEDREALLKAGFQPVPNIAHSFRNEVFSAVQDVDDLMEKAVVSLDDVAVLIDEANPTLNPEFDGLGSWDPEAFEPEDWAALETAYADAVSDAKVGA